MIRERLSFRDSMLAVGFGLFIGPDAADARGPAMYKGSLSLHYFGNDVTVGYLPKSPSLGYSFPTFHSKVYTVLPLGTFCNSSVSAGMTCASDLPPVLVPDPMRL